MIVSELVSALELTNSRFLVRHHLRDERLRLMGSSDFTKAPVIQLLDSINTGQKSILYLVYVWSSVAKQRQHNGVFSRSKSWGL